MPLPKNQSQVQSNPSSTSNNIIRKESVFCNIYGLEVKELDGELVRGGYIATTHLDSGWYDEDRGVYIKDQIAKETLDHWATEINDGVPRANKVSVNHDREPHVTGVGVKGTARVDVLPDGEFGLYVDTLIDSTKETYDSVKSRLDNGLLDSFSIEFTTKDQFTGTYNDEAVREVEQGNGLIRTLLPGSQLQGWTLASQPMNEHAVMIKEILAKNNTKEDIKMVETKEKIVPVVEPKKEEVKVEEPVVTPEAVVEDPKPTEETPKPTEETPKPEEEVTLSGEEKEKYERYKTMEAKSKEEAKYSELKEKLMTDLKLELKEVKVENKIQNNNANVECKELVEFKEAITVSNKVSLNAQFAIAGKTADKCGLTVGSLKMDSMQASAKEYKNFSTNGTKLEFKGLGITTNQNTDTDYLLSAAELRDVFDPVIYNALNQMTTTWNLLAKDDYSNKGNNQVQFTLLIGANSTAAFYTGNAVTTGNSDRLKYMTKFKKAQVGVTIDGDMMAAARGGPIGDVFAQEVSDSTNALMAVINAALFAETGLETAAGIIGFEYICDVTGNDVLYNLTRSAANKLAPTTATDTYINGSSAEISISNLRKAKRQAVEEGADLNNLVWITSPIQGDKLRGKYDAAQKLTPTSSRFGFEGRPEFDGIPVFEDKDCNDEDWFLIDLETHRVGMWIPPTLEMLGKDSDSTKGFVKTYFATYNRAPRRMVMIYGNAT